MPTGNYTACTDAKIARLAADPRGGENTATVGKLRPRSLLDQSQTEIRGSLRFERVDCFRMGCRNQAVSVSRDELRLMESTIRLLLQKY